MAVRRLVVAWLVARTWSDLRAVAELRDTYDRAGELNGQGRYQEALPFAKKAVRLSEKEFGPDHPYSGILLSYMALLYHKLGRPTEAEPHYKRAFAILEASLGPENPDFAITLENYAELLRATDRSDESKKLETRAATIRAKRAE